jgi:hypothetical protein
MAIMRRLPGEREITKEGSHDLWNKEKITRRHQQRGKRREKQGF